MAGHASTLPSVGILFLDTSGEGKCGVMLEEM